MPKRSRKQADSGTPAAIIASPWIGGPCLELIYEFNERYLENLARAARSVSAHALPEILRGHRAFWLTTDAQVRRRASRCPFILADFQFCNSSWWRKAQSGERLDFQDFQAGVFPWIIAMDLARDVLTVAWYTARQDICLATILLGMPAEVAEIIGEFSLHDLWRIADQQHLWLRPRCENRQIFWDRLLSAAARDDGDALYDLHRIAFLVADAELRGASSVSGRVPGTRGP